MNVWDFVSDILSNKKSLFTRETEQEYVPYLINKALSYHRDCIIYANEMNLRSALPKIMQHDFYLNAIRARRRPFIKWSKTIEDETNLEFIQIYYGCSKKEAREILTLLDVEKIEILKQKTEKGGIE